jgi:hypothetical protein
VHWRPVVVHTCGVAVAVLLAIPREASTQGDGATWFGSGQIVVVYAAMATIINNVPVLSNWVYGDLLKQPGPAREQPAAGDAD